MTRKPFAPCGHAWMADSIKRVYRILFPTVFVDCRCDQCQATWTERYEFDFSVPLGGMTHQEAEAKGKL
jgi:hypothetical protein